AKSHGGTGFGLTGGLYLSCRALQLLFAIRESRLTAAAMSVRKDEPLLCIRELAAQLVQSLLVAARKSTQRLGAVLSIRGLRRQLGDEDVSLLELTLTLDDQAVALLYVGDRAPRPFRLLRGSLLRFGEQAVPLGDISGRAPRPCALLSDLFLGLCERAVSLGDISGRALRPLRLI